MPYYTTWTEQMISVRNGKLSVTFKRDTQKDFFKPYNFKQLKKGLKLDTGERNFSFKNNRNIL